LDLISGAFAMRLSNIPSRRASIGDRQAADLRPITSSRVCCGEFWYGTMRPRRRTTKKENGSNPPPISMPGKPGTKSAFRGSRIGRSAGLVAIKLKEDQLDNRSTQHVWNLTRQTVQTEGIKPFCNRERIVSASASVPTSTR
jgi:hypothetical protein